MHLISQQLRVFDAVIRRQSFTKAARELKMTQPAITHHMRVLEDTCGVKLVERVGNHVLPTAAGNALYSTSRQLMGMEHDLLAIIRGLREGDQGGLALATNTTGGMNVLLRILETFRPRHPDIDVQLNVLETDGVLDLLRERTIDIAVLRATVSSKLFDVRTLCPDQLIPVVSGDHPLAGRGRMTLTDLADVPLILPVPGSTTRTYITDLFDEAGLHARVAMEFNATEHIKKAVEANFGVGVISRWVIERDLLLGDLVALDIEGFPLQREYVLVQRHNSPISPAAIGFLAIVKEVRPSLHFSA
jgi:DNA-binding transcriptional LysR family regulator